MQIDTIRWAGDRVVLLDQTRLPGEERYLECRTLEDVAQAIERLSVRGAPAIGIAAAMGLALGAQQCAAESSEALLAAMAPMGGRLRRTRPTAVNLAAALDRLCTLAVACAPQGAAAMRAALVAEAQAMLDEDIACNRLIGTHGAVVIADHATVMTICNTGSLATGGYGTALGVIRSAVEAGRQVRVVACETRPLLQGIRLTAWELTRDNIPFEVIVDSAAAWYMRSRDVSVVIAGADRIAANGDSANKIGTYGLAQLARAHGVPFYIAAPVSTIDMTAPSGDAIPIEERGADEVRHIGRSSVAPADCPVWNPAFDVVPAELIEGIITEHGIVAAPYPEGLRAVCAAVP